MPDSGPAQRAVLRRRPVLPLEVLPVLLALAILGYVAGHSTGRSGSSERQTENAEVALGYPKGWRMAQVAPGIPQLSVANVVVIAPKGEAQHAGLLLGGLPPGETAPLPARFVAVLPRAPQPEIVNLVETQAYKYTRLVVPGYARTLTLFVIPNPSGRPMMLACYASPGYAAQMRACEQSVASVTTVGEPQAYQLSPEPRYAKAISAAVSALDGVRGTLAREVGAGVSASSVQRVATQLAAAFAATATALDRLQPSAAVARVHTALTDAVRRSRDGYTALATAIAGHDVTLYDTAKAQIARAEADVNADLRSFVLLGYGPATQTRTAASG